MKDKLREPLIICSGIFIMIALISGVLLAYRLNGAFGSLSTTEATAEQVEEEVFTYELTEVPTDYQRNIFNELLSAYNNYQEFTSEENLEMYAIALVKNFVADFYTWSNKEGRNDVGGIQFMSPEIQSTFKTQAIDNFYLNLNRHLETYGSDELLTVTNVIILDFELGVEINETNVVSEDIDLEMNELRNDDIDLETDEDVDKDLDLERDVEENEDNRSFIRVKAVWDYQDNYLGRMETFQRNANFLLVEEDGMLSIHSIEVLMESLE